MSKKYLSVEDVNNRTKEDLIELAKKHNLVLVGVKASISWIEKFKTNG